jgi:hypothetical protein
MVGVSTGISNWRHGELAEWLNGRVEMADGEMANGTSAAE